MFLTRNEKAKRTTIAPQGLVEKDNYYIMGDKFVRVLSFMSLPDEFGEALLAQFMNNSNYHIDMITEPSKLDVASSIKKEMEQLNERINKTNDPMLRETLIKRYRSYDSFVKLTVQNNTRTVNTSINIYVRADSLDELNEKTRDIRDHFGSMGIDIKMKAIPKLQIPLMQKNSPLFIGNDLPTETDFLIGLPLPTLSVAGLWPFIFNTLEDEEGVLFGREATTGGKIIFDQFFYLNQPEEAKKQGRTAGNMVVVGRTGFGKSTAMNLLIMSALMRKVKVIWCDPENKNQKLTKFVGGNYIEFGKDSSIINIFDLKPISSDEDDYEDESVMYNTDHAISNVVEDLAITFKLLWEDISDYEIDMLNEITVRTYRAVGITGEESFKYYTPERYPTFSTFSSIIDEMIEKYSKQNEYKKFEYDALKKLQMKMRRLVGSAEIPGQWSRYFNGTTSISTDALNDSGLVAIGTKSLFNVTSGLRNALLRLVFNYAWSICLGTDQESLFVTDEDHNYILVPEIASIKAQFQRRARKYNTCTLSGTQQVKDYNDEGIRTHGKAIFDNATYRLVFNLTRDGVEDLSQLISMTDQEKVQLENLPAYTALFTVGNTTMPVEILATEDELRLM